MLAYVSCAEDKRIMLFALDAGGGMALVQAVDVPGSETPSPSNMPLAFAPGRRHLYAALRSPPCAVTCFAVDPASGRLTAGTTTPLNDPMAYVAVDATGRSLLCASYKNGVVAVFPIEADGRVGAEPTTMMRERTKAHCILPSRAPGIVHATVLGHDQILEFALADGALTETAASPLRARETVGPRHLAWHPNLDVLYATNEHEGSVDVWAREATTAALALRQTAGLMPPDFSGNARAADLHVTPDGRFLYASVRTTSTISGFAVDPASGRLTPVETLEVGGSPRGFAVSPDSRFLLVGSQTLNELELYRIGPDGRLTFLARHASARNPSWIEIVPDGLKAGPYTLGGLV